MCLTRNTTQYITFSFLIFIPRADEATYLLSSSTTRGSASMSREPDRKGRPAWRRIVGFLLIVMSSLCVALSTGCVQALERRVPDIELTFGGKFALLLFTLPVYFCKGQRLDLLFSVYLTKKGDFSSFRKIRKLYFIFPLTPN